MPRQSRGSRRARLTLLSSEALQARRSVLAFWTPQTLSTWWPRWALVTSWSWGSLLALQALSLHHRARYPGRSCRPHGALLSLGPWHAGSAGSSLLSGVPTLSGESI